MDFNLSLNERPTVLNNFSILLRSFFVVFQSQVLNVQKLAIIEGMENSQKIVKKTDNFHFYSIFPENKMSEADFCIFYFSQNYKGP